MFTEEILCIFTYCVYSYLLKIFLNPVLTYNKNMQKLSVSRIMKV